MRMYVMSNDLPGLKMFSLIQIVWRSFTQITNSHLSSTLDLLRLDIEFLRKLFLTATKLEFLDRANLTIDQTCDHLPCRAYKSRLSWSGIIYGSTLTGKHHNSSCSRIRFVRKSRCLHPGHMCLLLLSAGWKLHFQTPVCIAKITQKFNQSSAFMFSLAQKKTTCTKTLHLTGNYDLYNDD